MKDGTRVSWIIGGSIMLSSFASASCSDSTPAAPAPLVCLDAGGLEDAACTPAYPATWEAVYTNSFQRSCTLSGVSCHASTGKQAGVDLSDIEVGYTTTKGKLRDGDPACSILVQRVMSTSGKTRMPPGRSLSEGERCAIIKWVEAGAPR
jgi:cytochrome c551/c552